MAEKNSPTMNTNAFDEAYAQLNAEQQLAVDTIDGPLLVIAGPGSGKTQLLSVRVANILRQTDIEAHSILCLTFTDSAAKNMRDRLRGLIGAEAFNVQIHTFHSFAVDVMERYPEFFYDGARFSTADELVQREMLEQIFSDLPHDNPLATMHPSEGFVYLRDTKATITHCKRAGITPDQLVGITQSNADELEQLNPIIQQYFEPRLSKSRIPEIAQAIQVLKKLIPVEYTHSPLTSLTASLHASLEAAYEKAVELDSTTPLSEWKRTYVKKNAHKELIIKESLYTEKLLSFAEIYQAYRQALFNEGYYDFDDMIIDVLEALANHEELRYELQEQYLYMLVDEFQDTNDAQMRLLELISTIEHTVGTDQPPNIMAVGDDDQAIYKFQGAELRNMVEFTQQYAETAVISLRENYRSTAPILELAQSVIQHNNQRLHQVLPQIEKELVANVDTLDSSDIVHHTMPTSEHEMQWVAQEIAGLIEQGNDPAEMAVITRNHRELQELVPYLQVAGVPIRYDRQQNVFTQPHVYQLIQLARFVVTLTRQDQAAVDELLPEILSYPMFAIDRPLVWELAVQARSSKQPWLNVMQASAHESLQQLAGWFQHLAQMAEHEPLAFMMDALIGAGDAAASGDAQPFVSPFKQYYFSEQHYTEQPQEYIAFLSSLRVFMQAVRDHKPDQFLRLKDLIQFVHQHQKNNIPLTDTSAFVNAVDAVQLLTAHKAKGLEFNTVFVLSAQEHVWMKRGKTSLLPMPLNVPITPERDSTEDQLRLLYVALTRAKHRLYITSYQERDSGREAERLRVLPTSDDATTVAETPDATTNLLTTSWQTYHVDAIGESEQAVLQELVQRYQMSVTHLNNFLNVATGGPQTFLLQNLLRFPQAKQPAGAYGTAVHSAIEQLYIQLRLKGELPSQEQFVDSFIEQLHREEMRPRDMNFFEKKGRDALAVYYAERHASFVAEHLIEANFSKQGVVLGEAHLAGKIDKMVPNQDDNTMAVVDFKTGKAFAEWKGKSPYDNIKLYNYRRQLVFYKLLVENSADYSQYTVNTGALEFVEPDSKTGQVLMLELEIETEEVDRLQRLIEVVYSKIVHLEFPDVSEFSPDLKGIIQFEDWLLQS